MILDYPGEPMSSLQHGKGTQKGREREGTTEERSEKRSVAAFRMEEGEHEPQKVGGLQKLEKARSRTDCASEPPGRSSVLLTP